MADAETGSCSTNQFDYGCSNGKLHVCWSRTTTTEKINKSTWPPMPNSAETKLVLCHAKKRNNATVSIISSVRRCRISFRCIGNLEYAYFAFLSKAQPHILLPVLNGSRLEFSLAAVIPLSGILARCPNCLQTT